MKRPWMKVEMRGGYSVKHRTDGFLMARGIPLVKNPADIIPVFPKKTAAMLVRALNAPAGKCGAEIEVSYTSGWGRYLAGVKEYACSKEYGHQGNHKHKHHEWRRGITKDEVNEHD